MHNNNEVKFKGNNSIIVPCYRGINKKIIAKCRSPVTRSQVIFGGLSTSEAPASSGGHQSRGSISHGGSDTNDRGAQLMMDMYPPLAFAHHDWDRQWWVSVRLSPSSCHNSAWGTRYGELWSALA